FDSETAEVDACKIEHLISYETGKQLLSFVKFLASDANMAKEVMNTFHRFQIECEDIRTCPICKGNCLLDEKTD
ncbi:MAG: hypothetical protein ACE5I1_19875, partial [bacterium]